MGSALLPKQLFLCLASFYLVFQAADCSAASYNSNSSSSSQLCFRDQSFALLQFIRSFSVPVDPYQCKSNKTESWKEGSDCCYSWDGVTCDSKTGHVIGLDLSCGMLNGALHSNSTLFLLSHLQKLDLSGNNFNSSPVSSQFGQFSHLTHLNLRSTGVSGSIPSEISHLSRLVSLDLSWNEFLTIEPICFNNLAQNLTQLKELTLDGVDMSLVAPSSLMNLSSSLSDLSLGDCRLQGKFPDNVFERSNLQILVLNDNKDLTGTFPSSNMSSGLSFLALSRTRISMQSDGYSTSNLKSVKSLYLSGCNLVGSNLALFGNLTQLNWLDLADNNFGGHIPSSFGNLEQLFYLDLSNTSLGGHLPPSLGNLKQLSGLILSDNDFTGEIPNEFANLTQLSMLDLSNNNLEDHALSSLGTLKQLSFLSLSSNNFTGQIPDDLANLTELTFLDLSKNNFHGQIPSTLGNLNKLEYLDLSFNTFTGGIPAASSNLTQIPDLELSNYRLVGSITPQLSMLSGLSTLDLSHNLLTGTIGLSLFAMPSLKILILSNNLFTGGIPDALSNLTQISDLDLSNNRLAGSIPPQLSMLSGLSTLDLSHNLLTGTIGPSLFAMPSLKTLVLSNNLFTGRMGPFLSSPLQYIDLSHNMLHGPIPSSVYKLENVIVLLLSSNKKLIGEVSSELCNLKSLQVLDLSHNGFSGSIPQCLGNFSNSLSVLHLGANNLQGTIPSSFSEPSSLTYLNLNGNEIEGAIPSSIINCTSLEFLDLSNNMIEDAFPNFLGTLPQLQVLVLRSNKLHGFLKSPVCKFCFHKLQILDLSNNNFSGPLPMEYFSGFKAMMMVDQEMKYMSAKNASGYTYSVTMTWKGIEIEFVKIRSALAIIDLSRNNFTEKIPSSIGRLKSLVQLNLSHNCFTGNIESSLGNLTNLESVDLSSNILTGRIPVQLVALSFLEVLNLSYNQLEGPIPIGKQFNTFDRSSYEGNSGLCGFPMPKECNNGAGQKLPPAHFQEETSMFEDGFGWRSVVMGYGCGVVFGLFAGLVVFITRKPAWFLRMVEGGRRQNEKAKRFRNNARRTGGRRN